MSSSARFPRLLEPGKIGPLELKNRIIMTAMGTSLGDEQGQVTDDQINWYARKARGGPALVIVEGSYGATAIDATNSHITHYLKVDDARFIPGLARLAAAIHANGARAAIQVSPGRGAQVAEGRRFPETLAKAVSPSGIPQFERLGTVPPRILTTGEIETIIEMCGKGAGNVKQAGFDLIEIHAHGGYLVGQFLSPYYNKRTDRYGGSLDNRCRFLLDIVASMRSAIGPDFALTVKYSIGDSLPGGWDEKQSQALARKLEAAGVNGIGVSSGVHGTAMPAIPPYIYPRGVFLPFAQALKEVVKLPVIVGGRMNDPQLAEKSLKEGKADFFYQGRALIADPDWPEKVASGRIAEIRPCLACNECQLCRSKHQPPSCTVNAVATRETKYDAIKPAAVKKKVLVVGGGPAGLEAARVAALRGHQVILCERRRKPGGLLLLGGVHNEEISSFAEWLVSQVKKLPVEVRLQTEVNQALVEEVKPDAVIMATGGTFVSPEVPGIDRDNVFSSKDMLSLMQGIPVDKGILLRAVAPLAKRAITASTVRRLLSSNFPIKKKVAIIGGQFPGCSLAILLAHKGKKVTIIEESDHYAFDMAPQIVEALNREVEHGAVKILTSARVQEINDEGVIVADAKGKRDLLEADSVIVALELAPSDSKLAAELNGKVKEVYTIGDAKSFQRIKNAISEGYATAFTL